MKFTRHLFPFALVGGAATIAILIVGAAALDAQRGGERGASSRPDAAPTERMPAIPRAPYPSPRLADTISSVSPDTPISPPVKGGAAAREGNERTAETRVDGETETNATEFLAKTIAGKLFAVNPNGLLGSNGAESLIATLDPEKLFGDAMTAGLPELDLAIVAASVPANSLTIAPASDARAVFTYILALSKAINEGELAHIRPNRGSPPETEFRKMAVAADHALVKLSALPVPPLFVEWHRTYIAYVTVQKRIFEILASASQDPFKAMLAFQTMIAADTELADAQNRFRKTSEEFLMSIKSSVQKKRQ